MTGSRKATVILIIAGVCLPLLLLFFASGYDPEASLAWNLHHVETVLRDQYWTPPSVVDETIDHIYLAVRRERAYLGFGSLILKPKIAVRYKYVVLSGIILIVIGTGLIPTTGRDREHRDIVHHHYRTKV